MKQPQTATSDNVRAEAATWFAKQQGGRLTASEASAFEKWQNADPRNRLAYEQCAHLWLMTSSLRAAPKIAEERAIAQRLVARRSGFESRWRAIAAVAAVVVVGFTFYAIGMRPHYTEYATAVGEQELVHLDDGSNVTLNTQSRLQVRYSEGERLVVLQQGEAFFSVAKNAARPFVVEARGSRVQALGTAFNVALSAADIEVAVTEGTVAVSTGEASAKEGTQSAVLAKLSAGEGVRYAPGQHDGDKFKVNLEQVTAWQSRKIYFDNERLTDAIADYNRYTKQRVVLVDRQLADQRISGVFNMGDMDSFTFALQQTFNARIVINANRVLVLRPDSTPDLPQSPAQ